MEVGMQRLRFFSFVPLLVVLLVLTGSSFGQFVSAGNLDFTIRDFQTATGPYGVGVGDFNNDGTDDLAVANEVSGSVSVLLGRGNGTFQTHVDYPTGSGANSVTVADLIGNGKLDLLVTNGGAPSTVSVLLGNGDGTFQAAVNYTIGDWAHSLVVGDFNGDGKLDLIAANFADSTFSLLLGNGDGTFQTAQTLPASHQTISIATADFNRDGNLDLAGADSDNNLVTVYLGNGNGTFAAGVDYAGGSQPSGIAIGDFNGDHVPDLAVSNVCADSDPECFGGDDGTTSIFLGTGDGTFQAKKDFPTGPDSLSIALGDFNGDGKLDVAVANGNNEGNSRGTVTVQLGNGDGTLQPAKAFTVGNLPDGDAVGHFDGSGAGSDDIAVANLDSYSGDTVSVLLNNAGTRMSLTSSPNPSTSGEPVTLSVEVESAVKGQATPTGSITFYYQKQALASGQLDNGRLSLDVSSLPVGNDPVTANYAGDTAHNPNVSKPHTQVVNQ
jgi:hypothetical protein